MIISEKIDYEWIERIKLKPKCPTTQDNYEIEEFNRFVDDTINEVLYRRLCVMIKSQGLNDNQIIERTAMLHRKFVMQSVKSLNELLPEDIMEHIKNVTELRLQDSIYKEYCDNNRLDWYSYYMRLYNE